MAKPIILTLDDEPQVLNAVERDLRQHFRSDYRIIKSNSGVEALQVIQKLMKPWDPPEQNLYPVLDDLLSDWQATVPLPYDGIRVAGTLWSAKCHAVKDFLGRNRIPYQWLDIEKDQQAKELVDIVSEDQFRLPVVFFPDGSILVEPDDLELAEKVGLQLRPTELLIFGNTTIL